MNAEAVETNLKQLRTLIGPFADAATTLDIEHQSPDRFHVRGIRRFTEFDLDLTWVEAQGEFVRVPSRGGRTATLSAILSGSQFANLDGLARSMLPFLKERLGDIKHVVPTYVNFEVDDEPATASADKEAISAIRDALKPAKFGTRLTFLHGHAGVGKSWILMHHTLRNVQEFLSRETSRLDLYVDAQGVNLRSLQQQIARQLDDYNGILRFPEVVPLARLGLLGIIVDGFDELISPAGARDTLRALCGYLTDFEGEGAIVASARSSFFQLQDLKNAKASFNVPVQVNTLCVVRWRKEQWHSYCTSRMKPQYAPRYVTIANESQLNESLLGRAFVVSELFKIIDAAKGNFPAGGLMMIIENAFAERERTNKLTDPDKRDRGLKTPSPLLTREQFSALLLEVATEMWMLRQTTLDVDTLRTLASIWAEAWKLDEEDKRILIDRIDSNAFLEPTGTFDRRLQFPHEVLFARTLARAILKELFADFGALCSLLRVAPVSKTIAEQVADISGSFQPAIDEIQTFSSMVVARKIAEISGSLRRYSDDEANIRTSLGTMLSEVLRVVNPSQATREVYKHLHFAKVKFNGATLRDTLFYGCLFETLDARNCDWTRVRFEQCDPIGEITITEGQRFDTSLPPVHRLKVHKSRGEMDDRFGTAPCRAVLFGEALQSSPAQNSSETARAVAEVTEALARHAQRIFWFTKEAEDTEDRSMRRLKKERFWPKTIELLDAHGLIEWDIRQRSGVVPLMFHLKMANEILESRNVEDRVAGTKAADYWNAVDQLQ
jgi:hypothetical protein